LKSKSGVVGEVVMVEEEKMNRKNVAGSWMEMSETKNRVNKVN